MMIAATVIATVEAAAMTHIHMTHRMITDVEKIVDKGIVAMIALPIECQTTESSNQVRIKLVGRIKEEERFHSERSSLISATEISTRSPKTEAINKQQR